MATGTIMFTWTNNSSSGLRVTYLNNNTDESIFYVPSNTTTGNIVTIASNGTATPAAYIRWLNIYVRVNNIYELCFAFVHANTTANFIYADDDGIHNYKTTSSSDVLTITNPQPISSQLSYLTSIIVNATSDSLQSVTYDNTQYTSFPATISLVTDPNLYVVGKPTNIILEEGQNIKSVIDGANTYNTFPATISNVYGNKTLTLNGKDDPTITIDYTNTTTPVVTNT